MSNIDQIVADIRHDLGGTGWFGATTSGDINNADHQIEGLNAQDANAVVAKMSDGDLKSWADNANSWTPWDGVSDGDKRDLLNNLAGKLDGQQLVRVSNAFGVNDVTNAVISHGSAETRAQYVQALAGQINADPQIHAGLGSSTTTYGNDAAQSAVKVLASLSNNQGAFDQAVKSLNDAGKLNDVLKVAAGRSDANVYTGGLSLPDVGYDPSQLNRIINTASTSTDINVRTDVFKAAMPQLGDMQQNSNSLVTGIDTSADGAASSTAKAMSQLLTPDQARAAGLVPNVPVKPATASLQQNVTQAQQHGAIWVTKDMVPNKHPWDYKQQGAQYQDFGNFNFGVVEAAASVPENIALRGAGWAQQQAHTSKPDWGNPWDPNGGPYGDDPVDQAQIKAGYDYYNSGAYRLWSQ
jgi:Bacterial toxin 44